MTALAIGSMVLFAIIAQTCNKKIVTHDPPSVVVFGMYVWACLFSLVSLAVSASFSFQPFVALIALVNILEVWLFARSVRVGLAQSILLVPLTVIITIALSGIFLGEWHLLDPSTMSGLLTVIGVMAMLAAIACFGTNNKLTEVSRRTWWLSAGLFVVILGTVNFAIKYFAGSSISFSSYLVSWYAGSMIGATAVLLIGGAARQWRSCLSAPLRWWYALFGGATVASMASSFWSLSLAPATIVYPLFSFFYVLGVVLIALFFFREWKMFAARQWIGLALGLLGFVFLSLR